MDAILFHPSERKSFFLNEEFVTEAIVNYHIFRLDIYKWLSIVHELPEGRFIKDRLQALKAKLLIEDIGDGFNGVIVHDLYLDFAKSEVRRGALDAQHWVWYDKKATYPTDLTRTPSGNCWSNVERISVKYFDHEYKKSFQWMTTMEGMKWQQFCNVVVLQLYIGKNDVLDLRGLQCLKSMELRWNYEGFKGRKSGGQLIGLGSLRNLAWLELCNLHFAPCFQEIGQLTRLEVLRLDTNCFCENLLLEPLEPTKLDNCIHLQELVLECRCLESFPNLSKLTALKRILFEGCVNANKVVGLCSQRTSLQELWLLGCDSLSQCPGLSDVVSLQRLDVVRCSQLRQILDLHKLTKLQRLNIWGTKVTKFLGLNNSMPLQELLVGGFEIEELPNLHLLRHLQRLKMEHISPSVMPLFDNFIALEELILNDLPEVRKIHGMHSLTRLKRLTISFARNLLQLPDFGDLMALQYLYLHDCCRFVENLDLPDIHNLVHLEVFKISRTPIKRLPSLKGLTQLRELHCPGTLLTELPVLNGLDKLERIDLSGCRKLTTLENMGTLHALTNLDVSYCSSLTRLPDIRSWRSLLFFRVSDSGVSLGREDIMTLATFSSSLLFFAWDGHSVPFSELLEERSLEEVVLYLEAKKRVYFTRLPTRTDLSWMIWKQRNGSISANY